MDKWKKEANRLRELSSDRNRCNSSISMSSFEKLIQGLLTQGKDEGRRIFNQRRRRIYIQLSTLSRAVPPPLAAFPQSSDAYLSHVKNMTLLRPVEAEFGDACGLDG